MDPTLYIAAAVLIAVVLGLLTLLKKTRSDAPALPAEAEGGNVGARAAPPRNRGAAMAGGARRRVGPRNRMRVEADESDEEGGNVFDQIEMPEGKIGAKKMRKLEEKAEKKKQREADLQAREEKKEKDAKLDALRKQQEAREEAEEAAREEEERKRKEEEEKREYEEYLKLKEAFSVDEEGTHEEELNQDTESLLLNFINYIKDMKVVMLEDLAAHFKLKTQEAIDRVKSLVEEGLLSGVIDDRGKFIYITQDEYDAVAKFIRQRGRVSIVELAESSNQLINLNPDNKDIMHEKMVGTASA